MRTKNVNAERNLSMRPNSLHFKNCPAVNSNNFVDDEFKLLLSIQYYAYHELCTGRRTVTSPVHSDSLLQCTVGAVGSQNPWFPFQLLFLGSILLASQGSKSVQRRSLITFLAHRTPRSRHAWRSSSLRHHHFLEGTISRELGFVVCWCMVSMDAVHARVMCLVLLSAIILMNKKIIATTI